MAKDAQDADASESTKVLLDFTSGTVGGMLGILAAHPLDTAKTRLQAMPSFEGSSTSRVLRDTFRLEGAAALYRGMSFPLYSAAVLNAIIFAVQGSVDRACTAMLGEDRARLSGFVGGCVAGLVQSPIVSIADLIKCQRQVQSSAGLSAGALPGPVTVLRDRIRHLGVRQGCFQGFVSTAIKESPSYGMYFLVYEEARRALDQRSWPVAASTLMAGGCAGCTSLAMVHPVDVVKSCVQSLPTEASPAERSTLRVIYNGVAKEGAPFFLRGFGAAMQRAFVLNAATFGGYELALSLLTRK